MNEESIIDNSWNSVADEDFSLMAFDYDYRSYFQTITSNEGKIIDNQNKLFDLVNDFNTFLIFFLAVVFCYFLIKNFIRK